MTKCIAPKLTVALPVFNSREIVWLALESLANQQGIFFEWELIIAEEQNGTQYGQEEFEKWTERLEKVGCCRLVYIPLNQWIPLSQKWLIIGNEASLSSEAFLLQAADCYSYNNRLVESYEAMTLHKSDWYHTTKGLFYDINLEKSIMYNHFLMVYPTALNMAFKTVYIKVMYADWKNFGFEFPRKGVDRWLFNNCTETKGSELKVFYAAFFRGGVDTNGLNNISLNRVKRFNEIAPPFETTHIQLRDVVPNHVYAKLIQLGKENRARIESRTEHQSLVSHPKVKSSD